MPDKRGHWLLGKARVEGLGPRLRQARKEIGLTLEAAGERLGVATNTVWTWEAGRHEPSKERLAAIASLYGKRVEWFLGTDVGPQEKGPSSATIGEELASYRAVSLGQRIVELPKKQRALIEVMVETFEETGRKRKAGE
ncbi:MAG: helix-turn-helix transcriptional regulator [Dehalococcoidia bacterium]